MTDNNPLLHVKLMDIPKVEKARNAVLRAYKRLGNWRKVGEKYGLKHHRYVWDLAVNGIVPVNPEIRHKLGLPRVLPSERKPRKQEGIPRIGQGGWEGFYFRKVKVKK